MTINTALEQLLEVELIRQEDGMYISITVGNFRCLLIASPYYLQAISLLWVVATLEFECRYRIRSSFVCVLACSPVCCDALHS